MKSHDQGFTLIEVLIALAIISIAMTAIIKALGQSIKGTQYLQDKTYALWVGENMMNEILLGSYLPVQGNNSGKRTIFNRDYFYHAGLVATPNQNIKKVDVRVYAADPDDNTPALIHLESFLYVAAKTH